MNGMLRVPRSRGALSGLLLVLLGAWGALIPFIGPDFHYAYTPDSAWTYTTGRFWLEILPGCAVVLGGLIVLISSYRPAGLFGAWLAALSGAKDTLTNAAFRSQLEKTLASSKELNQAMASQRRRVAEWDSPVKGVGNLNRCMEGNHIP